MTRMHIVPKGSRWRIERDGTPLDGIFYRLEDAVDTGRRMARDEGLELVIHGRDGSIRDTEPPEPGPETISG